MFAKELSELRNLFMGTDSSPLLPPVASVGLNSMNKVETDRENQKNKNI